MYVLEYQYSSIVLEYYTMVLGVRVYYTRVPYPYTCTSIVLYVHCTGNFKICCPKCAKPVHNLRYQYTTFGTITQPLVHNFWYQYTTSDTEVYLPMVGTQPPVPMVCMYVCIHNETAQSNRASPQTWYWRVRLGTRAALVQSTIIEYYTLKPISG